MTVVFGLLLLPVGGLAQEPEPQIFNPLSDLAEGESAAFTERPLFSQNRRPIARAATPVRIEAPRPSVPSVAGLRLIGTVQSSRGALARVQDGSAQTRTLRNGETISGWTVSTISRDSITLQQGEHSASLSLFAPDTRSPAQAASTQAASTQGSGNISPSSATAPVASQQPQSPASSGAAAPRGTVAGTAAAEAAANSPFRLTFGGSPQPQ